MSTLNEIHNAYSEDEHENLSTKDVLTDLFKENTGRHMLDSGGAYGRNWEENNDLDDLEEDKEELTTSLRDRSGDGKGEVETLHTVSTFHFLLEMADFSEKAAELSYQFKQFEEEDDSNDSWLSLMERFVDHPEKEAHAVNTYNHEFNNLDQIVQFVPFTLEHDGEPYYDLYGEFVLIQIHGGCDVRGGYTAPIVLELGVDGAATLSRGASDLRINTSTGRTFDFIEHEAHSVELNEHGLRAVPRDLKDEVDDSDDVDFIVYLDGNEVSFSSSYFRKEGTRSVDPNNFKDGLWKKQKHRPNDKKLTEA